jgi:hypothetical protein
MLDGKPGTFRNLNSLRRYLERNDLSMDAARILKISQQLGLFDEEPSNDTPSNMPDLDRFNLDIKWSDYVVPEEEIEMREAIIRKLLEAHPERDKQSVIDEVIGLRTGTSFEFEIKKYLKQFPELRAKDPEIINERQLRFPGVDPAIRFMPRVDDLDKQKQEIRDNQDQATRRRQELRELWREKKPDKPLSRWDEEYRLKEFAESEGQDPLPEKLSDHVMERLMKADLSISQDQYDRLESDLQRKYLEVKSKEDSLRQLISSAKASIPEEPEAASLVELNKISEYQDDLKKRIIYLSYNVIVNSARWSVFGMPQPEALRDNYNYRSDIGLFDSEDAALLSNPGTLGDYMQKTPTLMDTHSRSFGWHSVPSPEKYFRVKNDRLEGYEDSLNRATKSYEKGLRFLKRLDKMLTKALEESPTTSGYPDSVIKFVEMEMAEDIKLAYQSILKSLYNEVDDVSRERHYSHYGHEGAFNIDTYTRDANQAEEKALSLFDIDKLFHNKIKFYEVIENFESLINVLIKRPLRKFSKEYFRPALEEVAGPIQKEILQDIFGESLSDLNDFRDVAEYIASSERGGHLNALDTNALSPGPSELRSKMIGRDQKALRLIKKWVEASSSYSNAIDYNSVLVYPKFIIKDKEVSGNVIRDINIKLVFAMAGTLFGHDSYGNLRKLIISEANNLIESGKINFKGSSPSIETDSARIKDALKRDILGSVSKIKKSVVTKLMKTNLLQKENSIAYSKQAEASEIIGRTDDYASLAKILFDEKHVNERGRSYGYDRYRSSEDALSETLSGLLTGERAGSEKIDEASGISGSFKKALLSFDKRYTMEAAKLAKLFDLWSLFSADSEDTDAVLKEYFAPFPLVQSAALIRNYIEDKLGAHTTGVRDGEDDSDQKMFLNIMLENPALARSAYEKIKVLEKDVFEGLLQRLAGEESIDHRLESNYNEYTHKVNAFNEFVEEFFENLGPAKSQLDTLIYSTVYAKMFEGRLNTFKTVGPRKIRKFLQNSKKKASREFGLTMFNPWIKKSVSNAEELADKIRKDPWSVQSRSSNRNIDDPLVTYWANGGVETGGTYADKPSVLTIMLKKKFRITDEQEVRRIYDTCYRIISNADSLNNYGAEDIRKLVPVVFDDIENLDSKIKKLIKLAQFAHNNAADMPLGFYRKVYNDPNFKNLGTNATVGKYFDMCTKLGRMGGLAAMRRKYKGEIEALRINGMLERGFLKTLRESFKACREGFKISPNLEGLSPEEESLQRDIRNKLESVDTMLTAITEYSALSAFNERVVKKDPALFNLDWNVPSKNFRFRVLKTFDPYHFRVGADTGCCQRLGGLGQPAAVDSYINPLAGVLVLELKGEDGWRLASQSYFHYVPRDGSYILDNVEKNYRMASRAREITGYSLENLYAMIAEYAKREFNVKYFLSGSGYSKIDGDSFKKKSLHGDPRSFAVSKKYTDWKSRSSIDLLTPKFEAPDITGLIPKKKRKPKKNASTNKLADLSLWLEKNSFIKEAGFITKLKEEVSKDMAVQMEDLEEKYFSGAYAQDYLDILDDMQQPGVSGIVYTDDEDSSVRGYLYGFELSLEDQLGVEGEYDEESLEELLGGLTCYHEECSSDPRLFLEQILSLAGNGEIFYATNFLVDKKYRRVVPELIHMLVDEVKKKGYKYIAFNALSATHRLVMSSGEPSRERENKFGIKILCELDMYAPFFIAEIM